MSKARDLASGQNGVRPFATSAGLTTSITGNASVTFPVGRFTQIPSVAITVQTTGANATSATTSSVTTSGFNTWLWIGATASTTARQCYWFAIQQTSDGYVAGTAQ